MSWENEKWVSIMGKWAWVVTLVCGLINLLWAIVSTVSAFSAYQASVALYGIGIVGAFSINIGYVWNIISSIILIIFSIVIVKPRFSKKCADNDWDYLLNDVLPLGSIRFPMIFVWAIIAEILLYWSGILIIIPAIMIIFFGPEEYQWKK
ncbi:MAG: hypothetical protein ACFFBP_16625 [Promethearchaeota archaeon]